MDSKVQENHPIVDGYSCLAPVLVITALPGPWTVKWSDDSTPLTLKCQRLSMCCHRYLAGTGILTGLPFDQLD